MATAAQTQNEMTVEMAEDRLWEIFAEHLDTLTSEKRHEVLEDLSATVRQIESKSNKSA